MIRSSIESLSSPGGGGGQYTPALRQFSQPKTLRESQEGGGGGGGGGSGTGEFSRPRTEAGSRATAQRARARYSDDEDEDEDDEEDRRRASRRAGGYGGNNNTNNSNNNSNSQGYGRGTPRRDSPPRYNAHAHYEYDERESRDGRYRDSQDYGKGPGPGNRRGYEEEPPRSGNYRNNDFDDGYGRGGGGGGGGAGRGGDDRFRYDPASEYGYNNNNNRDSNRDSRNYDSRDRDWDRSGYNSSNMNTPNRPSNSNNSNNNGSYGYPPSNNNNNNYSNGGNGNDKYYNQNANYNQPPSPAYGGGGGGSGSMTPGPNNSNINASGNGNMNGSMATPARSIVVPPDLSNMRRFLTQPLPKACGVVQCYIRRNKSGTHKLFPIYSLYLKEGDVFLMASKKRPKNKTSNYLISSDANNLTRDGPHYLGKLRSNFVGTEFQVFDDGLNPKDGEAEDGHHGGLNTSVRCELGAVMYAANVLGSRGPRKMQVALPGLDANDSIIKWKDGQGPSIGNYSNPNPNPLAPDDMLSRIKDRNLRDLIYLINKPPRWNEQVGAYVLNFNGRVTMASVKNFQLVDPEEQNSVVLQFGRVGKDEFTMDMQYPISPLQAFAVTLSSFDSKIACD
eukprot:scaffold1236_cov170-Ochromonas_danica.AAC.3